MRLSDWSSDVFSADLDRAHVAAMLGVTPAAIEKQRQRRQILGVPYGSENRYPAAQFAGGEALPHLKQVLESFGDTNPWEQLMLLTTPLEGYGEERETPFEILMRRPGPRSEEHTSELQSLMRISYAVFCLEKTKNNSNIRRMTTI